MLSPKEYALASAIGMLLCAIIIITPLWVMMRNEEASREAFCKSRKTSPWTLTFEDHRKCRKYWSDLYD